MSAGSGLSGYREFLAVRDGESDLLHRTLSHRERFFEHLAREPVRSSAHVDRETYLRNLVRRRPDPGLDDRMLWLLASAKANQGEQYAVGLVQLHGNMTAYADDPVQVHIYLQETYHTRTFAEILAIFELPVLDLPPPFLTRMIARWLVTVPERWRLPVTGYGEMAGCVTFRTLRDRGVQLFADQPEVAARIRLLYNEVIADETSHVGYCAARLGPAGRRLMRRLYRLLALQSASQLPEIVALLGRDELARRFRAPFGHEEMVAELPGLAYAAELI